MTLSLQQLQSQIQAMSSDRVKAVVLSWLTSTTCNLSDLENLVEAVSTDYQWGDINSNQQFQPLDQDQMIASSLAALTDYQSHPISIPHNQVKQ